MNSQWDLSPIYSGFDDPAFERDLNDLQFRIGDFAYITDAKTIDEENMEKLRGVRVMVINALRDRDHFSHFTLEESLEVIRKVQPRQAYLTHFNHEIGRHFDLARRLPAGVVPGHDGLSFSV